MTKPLKKLGAAAMKAICKLDYDQRLKERDFAIKEREALEQKLKNLVESAASRQKVQSENRWGSKAREKADGGKDIEKAREQVSAASVPVLDFYEFYGVWFYGSLWQEVRAIAEKQFGAIPTSMNHVFIDKEPKKIFEGVHEIAVYGVPSLLYRWKAQGYDRGLIVNALDGESIREAEVFMNAKTWSWLQPVSSECQ